MASQPGAGRGRQAHGPAVALVEAPDEIAGAIEHGRVGVAHRHPVTVSISSSSPRVGQADSVVERVHHIPPTTCRRTTRRRPWTPSRVVRGRPMEMSRRRFLVAMTKGVAGIGATGSLLAACSGGDQHPRRRPPQRLRRDNHHDHRCHPTTAVTSGTAATSAERVEDRHPGRSNPGRRPAQLERPIDPEGLPPHQRVASDLG